MAAEMALARSLIRRAETTELSLVSLEAIAEIRRHLAVLEVEAIRSAREKGATVDDIAEAMGLTPQAIYHRLRQGGQVTKRGRPKSAAAPLPEGARPPGEASRSSGVGSSATG
jgi:predicted transcriptional regulator